MTFDGNRDETPGKLTMDGHSLKLALDMHEAAAASGYSVYVLNLAHSRGELVKRYANSKPVILVTELQAWLESLPTAPLHPR